MPDRRGHPEPYPVLRRPGQFEPLQQPVKPPLVAHAAIDHFGHPTSLAGVEVSARAELGRYRAVHGRTFALRLAALINLDGGPLRALRCAPHPLARLFINHIITPS